MSEIDKHIDAIKAGLGEAADRATVVIKDAREKAGEALGEAGERADKALGDARDAFGEARAQAGETLKEARDSVADASEDLRRKASERYDRAHDWASEQYDSLSRNATYARRRGVAEFNRGRRGLAAFVEENPIMIGVAGLAAGLLIGALLPRTRREDELLGPYADDLRREGARYAKDAARHGLDTAIRKD